MEGKGLLQKDISKHPVSLDVQEPHSPCSCPKIGQTDIAPGKKIKKKMCNKTEIQDILAAHACHNRCFDNQPYLSSIMANGEICAGQFWFYKTLVIFKCLIQFVRKCFMC